MEREPRLPATAGSRQKASPAGQEDQRPACSRSGPRLTFPPPDARPPCLLPRCTHTTLHPRSRPVAVLIPALDEEPTIGSVIRALPAGLVDEIVVGDNGSRDGTPRIARDLGAVVVEAPRLGYGSACLAGLRHLARRPPAIVVFLDADGSDDPSGLARLIEPIRSGAADMVLGVRTGDPPGVPLHARMGNQVVLMCARLLFGLRFRDMPPFRAIRYDRLRELCMDDRDWGWTLQMQIRAGRLRQRIVEIEVPYTRRAGGVSKISGTLSGSLKAGAKMFYTLARERLMSVRQYR